MDIWLTADSHFDHANVIDFEGRPFGNELIMTEKLIEGWNAVVKPDDLIFHLGDVFFCQAERRKEIASSLSGRKILIRGNHDYRITDGAFQKLGFDVYKYYFFEDLIFSHRPQTETPLRTAIDLGLLKGNVHGHVHTNIGHLDQNIYKCVSVELTHYKPLHIDEVRKHFKYS